MAAGARGRALREAEADAVEFEEAERLLATVRNGSLPGPPRVRFATVGAYAVLSSFGALFIYHFAKPAYPAYTHVHASARAGSEPRALGSWPLPARLPGPGTTEFEASSVRVLDERDFGAMLAAAHQSNRGVCTARHERMARFDARFGLAMR